MHDYVGAIAFTGASRAPHSLVGGVVETLNGVFADGTPENLVDDADPMYA